MTTLSQNTKNEKGFSLLELLLVVAVGAVLILAGLAAYRLVSENNNVNEASRLLNTLKQQTQRAYQSEGDYGADGTDLVPILTDLRAFPNGTLNAAGVPQHPFGAAITIVASGAGTSFDIGFTNIERAACMALGQQFESAADSDFVTLSIGGADPDGDADGDITLAELAATCPAANAGGALMTWTFY